MNNFYAEELAALRADAAAYAKKYPALAPMLAGPGGDPDVERVLEGTAFLCGRIQERLSRNAPRLLQNLLRWTFPQALLPLPSSAMIRFWQQAGFAEALRVPRGTRLAARAVDRVSCLYSTDYDLFVPAAQIASVQLDPPAGTPYLGVTLGLRGNPFPENTPDSPLILYLAGDYALAAQRFFVLLRQVHHLEIKIGTTTHHVPATAVRQQIFPLHDARMPPGRRRDRAYMEIMRCFYTPEQLLFLRIDGLHRFAGARNGALEIRFCINPPFDRVPDFDRDSFALGVVAASNIFPAFADPLTIDHSETEYTLHPQDEAEKKLEILSVASVTGLFPEGRTETYQAYEFLRDTEAPYVYSVRFLQDGARGGSPDYRLMPLYARRSGGGMDALQKHVLSVALTCCNRDAPNALRLGDICLPTDDSPAQAVFENISVPTPMLPRPSDDPTQWLYLSHMSANLLPQASAELLRAVLELYIGGHGAAPERLAANRRRCAAILEFSSAEEDRLIAGRLYRGRRLRLTLDPAGFVSFGGMFLFANALERFLGGFTTINNYARLILEVAGTGERLEWQPRMGEKQLR
ncbi:MAG: type VI secretion system baseplate subunit TssF [Candidatus Accumulibacter sp.]|jgi:type VI secretion system protein ImpG|nr:type VI secretion system baseplate subunit TssF [Accumulibacter sp.]